MTVRWARNGEVDLAYETFGSPGAEPLLLIMGQGAQMVGWPDAFCELLAGEGFHVARFDNRDSGLSTHFTSERREHPLKKLLTRRGPRPYTGADLSDDVAAVLDALGWDSAHLLGASMGGTIAQAAALRHPTRVRSLTSAMAPPGDAGWRMLTYIDLRTVARFSRLRPGDGREEAVRAHTEIFRILSSPGYPFDEDQAREIAEASYDRHPTDPAVYQRQSGATWPGGRIRDIRAPTLVLHGDADPIIPPRAGRAVARAVPGARYVNHSGMGHDMHVARLWPSFAGELSELARRAAASSSRDRTAG